MTVPDETLTIRQIVEKHIRGVRVADALYRDPGYGFDDVDHDDLDLSKVRDMDLADKQELREQADLNVRAKQQAIRDVEARRAREEAGAQSLGDLEEGSGMSDEGANEPRPSKANKAGAPANRVPSTAKGRTDSDRRQPDNSTTLT